MRNPLLDNHPSFPLFHQNDQGKNNGSVYGHLYRALNGLEITYYGLYRAIAMIGKVRG